jgi:hypothetical protein
MNCIFAAFTASFQADEAVCRYGWMRLGSLHGAQANGSPDQGMTGKGAPGHVGCCRTPLL